MFIAALFTVAKIWKQPEYTSVEGWIKEAVVHLHGGILLGHKRKNGKKKRKSYLFVTAWMDLELIILNEITL